MCTLFYCKVAFSMLAVVLSLLSPFARAYTQEALLDQVVNLPGTEGLNIPFNQFSGYLNINEATGKRIHYWFVESERDPVNDPVVFWTNGGPGCSGLIAFMTEQGPFRPTAGGQSLTLNEYAWNKVANMVFIEQPSGVGFSYSDNTDDYKTNDTIAANDNYLIIQTFLARFPEYKDSSIYTTAESYGGHFMPQVAQVILNENKNPNSLYPKLNYKGYAVGNPFTTRTSEYPAMFYTYWGHQLISKSTWDAYSSACGLDVPAFQKNFTICEGLEMKMMLEVGRLVNPYAINYPACTDSNSERTPRGSFSQMRTILQQSAPEHLQSVIFPFTEEEYEPCSMNYGVLYLNRADVKAALHVNPDIEWEECASIRYNMLNRLDSMTPIYNELLNQNDYPLDILVYSGDNDAVCGTVGTQWWIWDLGYEVKQDESGDEFVWKPWYYQQQTAGYWTKFETSNANRFAFITVHKAGHEVPTYVPAEALDLFERYISGQWF